MHETAAISDTVN